MFKRFAILAAAMLVWAGPSLAVSVSSVSMTKPAGNRACDLATVAEIEAATGMAFMGYADDMMAPEGAYSCTFEVGDGERRHRLDVWGERLGSEEAALVRLTDLLAYWMEHGLKLKNPPEQYGDLAKAGYRDSAVDTIAFTKGQSFFLVGSNGDYGAGYVKPEVVFALTKSVAARIK
ncbi:hypothetical protein sos41_40020 [Alphaproteobacteria bacterium SO-S41]|nr:hypothetical protein sos41_40020 [Alphaproteobacteria bacterium SO-S41]